MIITETQLADAARASYERAAARCRRMQLGGHWPTWEALSPSARTENIEDLREALTDLEIEVAA